MGLEIAKLRKLCTLCKKRRAQRYCLRYGKDICWVCCNDNRIDKKCPHECSYIIQKNDVIAGKPAATKVDSYTEHIGLITLEIDRWAEIPEKLFADKVPAEMALTPEGRQELEEYVNTLNNLPYGIISYMRRKFKLPPKPAPEIHYEDSAMHFLDRIIEQEWEQTAYLMAGGKKKYANKLYLGNYIKRRSENRLLKKVTAYHLIMSAISEKRDEALVYFEINGKFDLTFHYIIRDNEWQVESLFLGHPQLFYGTGDIEGHIYSLLYQNNQEEALKQLQSFSGILIDSKEIFYLYGLYYAMREDYPAANTMFLNCVEMEPASYDYRYNYAFTSMTTGNLAQAKELYLELLQEQPGDIKTLNNLAVIYLSENDLKKASEMWEKCLEIDSNFESARNNLEKFAGYSAAKDKK